MRVPPALARATFPVPVLDVLRRLAEAGHRSWLVGGAVRDLLLHRPRPATDFDVATPATPDQVIALFPRVIPTGVEHGTVTVLAHGEPIEVTTFRGEGDYRDGRRPESVTFHTDLTADLARRDFTMNALAFDPLTVEFRDPFGGRNDLRRRMVRAVGDPAERFGEDGLRPMRAVRFAAQLGYALDPATRGAIPGALDVVRKVAAERISDELSKLLVAPHAAEAVALLGPTGLLAVVLPQLATLPAEAVDHAAAVLRGTEAELPRRLAALLHGLEPQQAGAALAGLRLPRRTGEEAMALLRAHACLAAATARAVAAGPGWPGPAPADLRRWLASVGPGRAGALLDLARAEAGAVPSRGRRRARAEVKALQARIVEALRAAPPLEVKDLSLDGRAVVETLGIAPGPHVGEALRQLLDRVLDDPGENDPARLRAALRQWWAERAGRL